VTKDIRLATTTDFFSIIFSSSPRKHISSLGCKKQYIIEYKKKAKRNVVQEETPALKERGEGRGKKKICGMQQNRR
jgi:hypothetical protein